MLTTYRLMVSLAFIVAISAPKLRSDLRTTLAIAFATGLATVWHSGRGLEVPAGFKARWVVAVPVAAVLAIGSFVAVWNSLNGFANH